MDSTTSPRTFVSRRRDFWRAIERRAGGPRGIVRAFREAGHEVAEKTVGFWIRGQADPGTDPTLWAASRWGVSLDEYVSGQALAPVEVAVREVLEDQERRLHRVEAIVGELQGWMLEVGAVAGVDVNLADALDHPGGGLRAELEALRAELEALRQGA